MLRSVRVLFVAYLFPPVGGAGVQRVAKLVRHLPAHGITPVVLTASNPSVPVRDETLLSDIGANIRIERVPTLEPSYGLKRMVGSNGKMARSALPNTVRRVVSSLAGGILFPDPQVLWLPSAALAIGRLAREPSRVDAVVMSAPPFSQMLLIPWIQRALKVPILVDYRDEWETTLRVGHELPAGTIAARLARGLERELIMRVDAVTTATEEFRTALLDRVDALDPGKVHFLPNGWDADDLPRAELPPPIDRFRISYVGTVLRLTSLRSIVAALRILHAERPDLAACIELIIHGRVAPSEKVFFEGAERLGLQIRGYLEHREALAELARSHLNLCVLDDVEGADRIYPAKIFELMAVRRRVLVVAPPGALERLAKRHKVGDIVSPSDPNVIASVLSRHVEAWQAGSYQSRIEPADLHRFDRRVLAGELACILSDISEGPAESKRPAPPTEAKSEPRIAG